MSSVHTFIVPLPYMTLITHSADDPETFTNAPISVQLVGRTLEEEAIIGMAEVVDAAVKAFHAQARAKV